jgi:transporter family-2 protein
LLSLPASPCPSRPPSTARWRRRGGAQPGWPAVVAFARGGLPDALAALPQQPLWKFSGGFLGAAFIFCTVMLAPRIGLLNLVVLVIAGQLITSMAIDHFGLVNVVMRKVSTMRLLGAAIMIVGVGLALFGDRIAQALDR